MSTLIALYTSDGCVGRGDVRYHNATTPAGGCICGGRYHGLGTNAATRPHRGEPVPTRELLQAFAASRRLDDRPVGLGVHRLALFGPKDAAAREATR